jgi:RNA polymerase sigma-70 factor (ECF subfamily)
MDPSPHPPLLERLFSESAGDLERYFSRRHSSLAGEAGIQDLVQETFLQMARTLEKGRTLACARGYLFGIARHISQAAWSRRGREESLVPMEGALVPDGEPVPDDRVAAAREVMAAMPALQREILDLRFAQDLSYAEIAAALEIPVGTVRSRLHHAVAALRGRLESEDVPPTNANSTHPPHEI